MNADPYDLARARAMLIGYDARWGAEQTRYDVLAVEAEFNAAVVNPATNSPSRTWRLGGKLDVLVYDRIDLVRVLVEHKTTSENACPGSDYIKRLRLDGQVSIYFDGSAALDLGADKCMYDVLTKPALRPGKATPPEARKYTKDGRLYANQRDADETPEEFFGRLIAAICEDPNRYFTRADVVRLDAEMHEARLDLWDLGRSLRENHLAGRYPRNPDACVRYGRTCEYFEVCTGEASLDDPSKFQRSEVVHAELSTNADAQLLTHSRLACARRCQREHKFRYIDGIRPVAEAATLRFGSLIHRGLEAWWRAGDGQRLAAALDAIEPIQSPITAEEVPAW